MFAALCADPLRMSHESIDTLGTRRLRAAANKAYASAVCGDALADAKFRGVHPDRDPAVLQAAAYVEQTRLVYNGARFDHEYALDAAVALELALTV